MKEAPGTRLADLIRMPVGERRAALRGLVSKAARGSMLRSDVAAATTLSATELRAYPFRDGWQDRVLAKVRETEGAIEVEGHIARELLTRLLELPHARRLTLVRNSRRFHQWSLCQLLSRESVAILFRDPQAGLEVAQLATEIAEAPHLKAPTEALLSDLRGICWTYLGNAQRATSLFPEAEASFARANAYLREGTGDPIDLSKLIEYKATLRLKQRRFPEATTLYDQAVRISLGIGDRHAAGASVIGKAIVCRAGRAPGSTAAEPGTVRSTPDATAAAAATGRSRSGSR